jgi:hypothetical protein
VGLAAPRHATADRAAAPGAGRGHGRAGVAGTSRSGPRSARGARLLRRVGRAGDGDHRGVPAPRRPAGRLVGR